MSQSPELAGGAGFTFEDAVGSVYVVALLQEGYAPGIDQRTVCRVALQQRDFGEPLDDIIVDFQSSQGDLGRLSLQVKRELTISAAGSNTEFRDVVRDCWLTLQKADFRLNVDRFGAAVGDIASGKARDLRFIGEMARASISPGEFVDRFEGSGNASQAHRALKQNVVTLVEAAKGFPCTAEEIHRFFAHLVLIKFDFLHGGATSEASVLSNLKACVDSRHQDQVPLAWAESPLEKGYFEVMDARSRVMDANIIIATETWVRVS